MYDPDFGQIVEKTATNRVSGLGRRRLVLGILLIPLVGFFQPFTNRDHLDRPTAVKRLTEKEIVLADGRHIALRFIKRLPKDDPVFRDVLEEGVEVDGRGEVFGLITIYPSCGMTMYRYVRRRINLGDLAGALRPDSIEESALPPEEIRFLKEKVHPPGNPRRILDHFLSSIRRVREARERCFAREGDPGLPSTGE